MSEPGQMHTWHVDGEEIVASACTSENGALLFFDMGLIRAFAPGEWKQVTRDAD